MARRYSLTFQLFDVTLGEKAGDVLDDTTAAPVVVSPLGDFAAEWVRYCSDAPVELLPPNIKAIRVAMARNGGAAIMRKRFDFEGRKYLVQMRVEVVAEKYGAELVREVFDALCPGDIVGISVVGGEPTLFIGGIYLPLKRAD